jgi:hypothetical protein
MLMDARAAEGKDGITSRITKAVDNTANANGLWTKRMRIMAIVFLTCLIGATLAAVFILQNIHNTHWEI